MCILNVVQIDNDTECKLVYGGFILTLLAWRRHALLNGKESNLLEVEHLKMRLLFATGLSRLTTKTKGGSSKNNLKQFSI